MDCMEKKHIVKINGPVILASGDGDFAMREMVYIGNEKLLGEVIKIDESIVTIQCYEQTYGLKIGDEVISTNSPLMVTLGPGMIGNIYDGIQRPLTKIASVQGDFIKRGVSTTSIDYEKKWHFIPLVSINETLEYNFFIGKVSESPVIENKIMYSNTKVGKVVYIAPEGEYLVSDIICKVELEDKTIVDINMVQTWPVRQKRPYKKRLLSDIPLITGQRVIDSLFPIAKGGTAAIPGGFGTGKTVLQHQLAKWCDADIIVYIGCGERGNEMTQVLQEFPEIIDPKTNRPLMERTILIANTSNMPVAAREASIYTGITIAEYYRDMGYDVAIMADSTSRWAEALREISGRLEEMPAEEGFPSYLPSRLSEFYGRAGRIESFNNTSGSITMIGAVSPQGSDFSEPVTQNTKRFVHVFWGLERDLAYSRHYPAINWMISYSEYVHALSKWYEDNVNNDFMLYREKIIKLLNEEDELLKVSKVVGADVLSDRKKLVLEVSKLIRVGFLQQNATSTIDSYSSIKKQYKLLELIIFCYDRSLKLIEKDIPIFDIKSLGFFEEYKSLKEKVSNTEIAKLDDFKTKYSKLFTKLEEEYEKHIVKDK